MQRTIVVTGVNRGLGLEFVRVYRRRGDTVIGTVRDPAKAGEAADEGAEIVRLDTGDEDSIDALAGILKNRPVDVLVNNAGQMGDDKTVDELSFDEFRRIFDTNAFGPALVVRALTPNLRAGGRKLVINLSSELGSTAQAAPGFSYAYSASKAALNMITARLAKDLVGDGITVVSFCPGWNKTEMGGAGAPLEPAQSIPKLVATSETLGIRDSGSYRRIDGSVIPY